MSVCESYCGEASHSWRNSSSFTAWAEVGSRLTQHPWITCLSTPTCLMPKNPKRAEQLGRDHTQAQMVNIWPKIRKRKKSTSQIHRQVFGASQETCSGRATGMVLNWWLVKAQQTFLRNNEELVQVSMNRTGGKSMEALLSTFSW